MDLDLCIVFLFLFHVATSAQLERLQSYEDSFTACVVVPTSSVTETPAAPPSPLQISTTNLTHAITYETHPLAGETYNDTATRNNNITIPDDSSQPKDVVKEYLFEYQLVVQYYVKQKDGGSPVQYFAGESKIDAEHLQAGYHKLQVEELLYDNKRWLEVWWDGLQVPYETNRRRVIHSLSYVTSHIEVVGPPDLQVLEESACDETYAAIAMTSSYRPSQLAVVASCIMAVLAVLSIVGVFLARRHCKSDFLPIAGHEAPPRRVQDDVAGIHTPDTSDSRISFECSDNEEYSPNE